ncbi:TPA: hypothetical protein HHH21_002191 [Escherichia coli]|nr:hypothetical protein [Escherichia coli]
MENQKTGYIPLYRSILKQSWAKDVYLRTLWENLLLNAARKPYKANFKGHEWHLQPGQLVVTAADLGLQLCDRHGKPASRDQVERMLQVFVKDGMISIDGEKQKGRVITITNYHEYAQKMDNSPAHEAAQTTAHDAAHDEASNGAAFSVHATHESAHEAAQTTAHHEQEGINKNINNTPLPPNGGGDGQVKPERRKAERIDYESFLNAYNTEVGDRLPHAVAVNEKRKRRLKKIIPQLKTPNVDGFRAYVRAFVHQAKPFYFGDNDTGWTADFDYLLREDSLTGVREVAFHLTGRYPGTKGYPADGKYGGEWKGKRFYEPVVFWIGGETNETVTKTTQRILCGRIEENDEPGYGSIPKEDIISWKKSPFFPNLVDHLLVKHHTADGVEDGISICYFKPYSQGRARWQGDTIHGVWFDEEPPYSIYGEGLTRTNKYGQFSILTFTPLMGMSDVVTKFLKNPSKSQKVVNMTIYDAEHYTDEQKEQIIASYPEHEREARARGIPTMGSGRIFQIPEETIKCQPFECPDHFYVIGGMDFGWDHPQAQVQLWWDKDADTIYVSRVWKAKEKTAVQAWGAVKSWAHKVPTAWPHDGNQHEKGGGEQLKGQYADAGFMMLQEHATWPDGGNAVEPGITELRDMMLDGRFKVFNTCEPFFEEFRLYHRDENGKIVKLNDDVLSAVRYAYMMRRFAKMMRDIKKPKEKKIPAPIRPIARRT